MCFALNIALMPVKLLFCISTILYVLIGGIFILTGPLILYSADMYITIMKDTYYTFSVAPKILTGLGSVLVIIGVLGYCGVSTGSKILLKAYIVLSLLVLILDIVLVVITTKEFLSSDVGIKSANSAIRSTISKSEKSQKAKLAIDYTQVNLECCGAEGKDDWKTIPISCCKTFTSDKCDVYYINGCGKLLFEYFKSKMHLIGGFCGGAIIFMVFGVVAAYLFIVTS